MHLKKICSGLLVAVMMISSCMPSMASTPSVGDEFKWVEDSSPKMLTLSEDPLVNGLKADDQVRIIVEVDEAPVIDTAIAKGVGLDELNATVCKQVQVEVDEVVADVKDEIKDGQLNVQYLDQYSNVFSGFSAVTTLDDAKAIENMPQVKNVYISRAYYRPTPDMLTSTEIINAGEAWNLDYKGQGMVVAVLDSGFSPAHKDMQLITDPSKARYQNDGQLPSGLPGKWHNIKMPYAYNYYDKNQNVEDAGDHGVHVAGTVAANGDIKAGGIKGVAPEAQLLGMMVFGQDPNISTTFSDIYLKAIEDAVKLGADAINMSLGSPAAYLVSEEEDPARVAIRKAAESGVIVVVSSGNSGRFGNNFNEPLVGYPDKGLVGAPSLNPYTLSVASINNTHNMTTSFDAVMTSGSAITNLAAGFNQMEGAPKFTEVTSGKAIEVVYVGNGKESNYEGKDVKGKIVLAVRTNDDYFYADIKNTAQAKGASGLLIRGKISHGDFVNMNLGTTATTIPVASLAIKDGDILRDSLLAGSKITVAFGDKMLSVPSMLKGTMADSSSWGTTPNLDFKPEITAPGGSIYSTMPFGQHGLMSGTSMAAPHVSGATALVMQRLKADYPEMKDLQRYMMAKNLMMSTANPLLVKGDATYTSPRKQGAGVLDVHAACYGDAIVVSPDSGLTKVNLKEINQTVSFPVEVKNYSNAPMTFDVSATIGTDGVKDGMLLDSPDTISGAQLKCSESTITVPAKGSKVVEVSFNLKDAKLTSQNLPLTEVFPNGNFVEGFVLFKSKTADQPNINIPYMGFYGEWDKAPIVDECKEGSSFYGKPSIAIDEAGRFYNSTADDNTLYMSPKDSYGNGDGYYDTLTPAITFLRNARYVEINILNNNKQVVKTLLKKEYVEKNHNGGVADKRTTILNEAEWDGQLNYSVAAGTYYYQIKTKVDYPNAKWQTVELPITIDNVKPVISNFVFDPETKKLVVKATDNTKLYGYQLQAGDKVINSKNGEFNLTTLDPKISEVVVMAMDMAHNSAGMKIALNNAGGAADNSEAKDVSMTQPTPVDWNNEKEVTFAGEAKESFKLKTLTINGKNIPFTFNTVKKVYTYSTKLALPEGRNDIRVIAVSESGKKVEFSRIFFHDITAPKIEMSTGMTITVPYSQNHYVIKANVVDNCAGFVLKVNGNMECNKPAAVEYMTTPKEIKYVMERPVNLEVGENKFVIEALDMAGNVTKIEYTVIRNNHNGSSSSNSTSAGGYSGSSAPAAGGTSAAAPTTTPKQTSTAPIVSNQGGISSVGMTLSAAEVKDMKASLALGQTEMKQIVDNIKASSGNNVEVKLNVANTNANEVKLSIPVSEMKAASAKPVVVAVVSNGVVMKLPLSDLKPQNNQDMLNVTIAKAAADGLKLGAGEVGKQSFTMTAAMTSGALAASQSIPVQIDLSAYNVNKDKTVLVKMNADGTSEIVGNKIVNGQINAEVGNTGTYVLVERNIDFKDVNAHWSENFVESMASKGIVSGYANGGFSPEKSVTRAEFITMLVKAMDLDLVANGKSFKDVSSKDWANQYVETAFANGIVKGAEGKFNPNANITRAEMAVMIANAMKLSSNDTKATTGTPDWAANAISAVMSDGLMAGNDGQFRPNDLANRAESATVIYKVFNQEAN